MINGAKRSGPRGGGVERRVRSKDMGGNLGFVGKLALISQGRQRAGKGGRKRLATDHGLHERHLLIRTTARTDKGQTEG